MLMTPISTTRSPKVKKKTDELWACKRMETIDEETNSLRVHHEFKNPITQGRDAETSSQ
jgi:hypothetical protein